MLLNFLLSCDSAQRIRTYVQTVNVAFYVVVLKRLRDRARRVRSELWEDRRRILKPRQCTRAFCINRALIVGVNFIIVLEHTPYSPDLAPCDFVFFPKCKLVLQGGILVM